MKTIRMVEEEIDRILSSHKKWLEEDDNGEKADLAGADLIGADLAGADLIGADLAGADLTGADLRWADRDTQTLPLADEKGQMKI